jgi:signal transduction histidine kinase/ligand-binding sensor domain-containing protein
LTKVNKHTTRFSVFLFLFIMLLLPVKHAGQPPHQYIEYTTENGLSLNSVNDLHFDQQGFLWIATADGLQKFDGYHFETFKHKAADRNSISDNSIAEIYEDEPGNLWITHRKGIALKPKGKNEFREISGLLPPYTFRFAMLCVYETDSAVWFIDYPTGIFAINKFTMKVRLVSSFNGFDVKETVFLLSRPLKKGDETWLRKGSGEEGDLCRISGKGLSQFPNSRKLKVLFIVPQLNDTIVMVTDKRTFKSLADNPFTPVKVLQEYADPPGFDTKYTFEPRKIANHQYLLKGVNNMMVYDAVKGKNSIFPYDGYFSKDLLPYLHTATTDHYENNWIGYNGIGGIKVISRQVFNLFKQPLRQTLPYTLAAGNRGEIYAGMFLGDIEVYSKEGIYLHPIPLPAEDKKFGSPRAMAMIDPQTLIVKSTINKLYAVDTRTLKVQSISHLMPAVPDIASREFEMDMHNISQGEIWYSYRNQVVSLVKLNNGYTGSVVVTLPVNERINSFCYTTDKKLWIGTLAGLWLWEGGRFTKMEVNAWVKHINQQGNGDIWVTTTDGIYIFRDKKITRHLGTENGLLNSFVYSVLFDKAGNGWISTNRGLAKIDTAMNITSYSSKEGLQGDEFNTKGYCKGEDGTLYFAGVNGINFINPEKIISRSESSPTMLTGIEVNNKPYLPGLQPEFITAIRLSYRENNIRFSFSNMDFTVPGKNQYKFWLKNFQNDWSTPQLNNIVQYILPPGNYQLYVLSANHEGVWSKETLIINIKIRPPWYLTTLAKIIFLLLLLGTVAAVFYFISRNRYQKKLNVLQTEQEVQKEKQRLSRDLHDNLGAQITWISNSISQLGAVQPQIPNEKLKRLEEGTGELMQTLRETIWVLNKDKISGIEFFDNLVTHAARFIESYESIQMKTEENIDTGIQLHSGQALQLFRICQEAITNACKHAGATVINITALSEGNLLKVCIKDNGKGFETGIELPGHYGLQNMKQRAAESNLSLTFDSSPATGTAVTVSVNT